MSSLSNMPLMLPGALLFLCGMLVLLTVLFTSGGVAKSTQFAAIGDVLAGRRGAGKRRLFVLGAGLTVLGTCGAFAGVAAEDASRRRDCEETCSTRGYVSAKIKPSEKRNPPGSSRHAFVACVCSDGPDPDPLEFRADQLPAAE